MKAETPEERRARVDREERERCLDTFKAPGTWPCWPFLPVKRRKQDHSMPDCGLMIEQEGTVPPRVYLRGLYEKDPPLDKAPQENFDNFEALLDAGWVVD